MGTHMTKTTIEIADDLARRAKALARRRGITLRAVIEDGIRLALQREQLRTQYRLPDRSFGGNGLRPEFANASWSEIREASYEGKYG
jgi:hypothetical protein